MNIDTGEKMKTNVMHQLGFIQRQVQDSTVTHVVTGAIPLMCVGRG